MKRLSAILLICVFLFSGCGIGASSDIFAVPEIPEMQRRLIETVESVLGGGFDYAEPKAGLNRQSLQLMDLDGDGDEDGIAFLRDVIESNKTFIYVFERDEDAFYLFDIIEGSENELYTVSYADLLGKDGYEIIALWSADGEGNYPVTVYNLATYGTEKILEISAKQYSVSDIDGNGSNDLLAVVNEGGRDCAAIYTSENGKMEKRAQVLLSPDAGKLLRIKTGLVSARKNGVFIEREAGQGVVTDIIAYDGSEFVNMLPSGEACKTRALAADVTGDGVIELPSELSDREEDALGRCYLWNRISSAGDKTLSAFTYHSYSENWYLLLPTAWSRSVSVSRRNLRKGEAAIRLSTRETVQGEAEAEEIEAPLFTVYVLTGANRDQYAAEEGRFIISEREDTVFAAQIASESYLATEINEEFIKGIFKNIESEWISEILFA